MSKPTPASPMFFPLMMMELALASWETIGRRTLMMAQGTCTTAEYSRMLLEKTVATKRSAAVMTRSGLALDWSEVMAPWHLRATANARRLRRG